MNRMDAIGVYVIGKSAAATDPGDEDGFLGRHADFWQYFFHLCKDRIIAAAGTPSNVLIASKIFGFEYGKCCAHVCFVVLLVNMY